MLDKKKDLSQSTLKLRAVALLYGVSMPDEEGEDTGV